MYLGRRINQSMPRRLNPCPWLCLSVKSEIKCRVLCAPQVQMENDFMCVWIGGASMEVLRHTDEVVQLFLVHFRPSQPHWMVFTCEAPLAGYVMGRKGQHIQDCENWTDSEV
jgi:hypothetical protein